MSNKYETGTHIVLLFDKHGSVIESKKHGNFSDAKAYGIEETQAPPAASFVITRTVFNSIDNSYPWNCKQEEIPK